MYITPDRVSRGWCEIYNKFVERSISAGSWLWSAVIEREQQEWQRLGHAELNTWPEGSARLDGMDHDRLFKELLTHFFFEFLDLFFEDIAALIDRSQPPIFLDKETFGELTSDKRRELDLVARVKRITGDAHFLVHLEPQAQWLDNFPEKMFSYFCRFWERHRVRIFPIAVLSFRDHPEVQESELEMRFPGLTVFNF